MILSSREVEALRLAGRVRAVMELVEALRKDLGDGSRHADLAAYVGENKNTVAARTDLDMTEARYVIGLGYIRGVDAHRFLAGPEFAALEATVARKLKLERLYRAELRKSLP